MSRAQKSKLVHGVPRVVKSDRAEGELIRRICQQEIVSLVLANRCV
jgi:hypothetical protein